MKKKFIKIYLNSKLFLYLRLLILIIITYFLTSCSNVVELEEGVVCTKEDDEWYACVYDEDYYPSEYCSVYEDREDCEIIIK